jgi:hypothetical protein
MLWMVGALVVAATLVAQAPSLGRISFPNSGSPAAQPAFVRERDILAGHKDDAWGVT